jgi:hypothetical protein
VRKDLARTKYATASELEAHILTEIDESISDGTLDLDLTSEVRTIEPDQRVRQRTNTNMRRKECTPKTPTGALGGSAAWRRSLAHVCAAWWLFSVCL